MLRGGRAGVTERGQRARKQGSRTVPMLSLSSTFAKLHGIFGKLMSKSKRMRSEPPVSTVMSVDFTGVRKDRSSKISSQTMTTEARMESPAPVRLASVRSLYGARPRCQPTHSSEAAPSRSRRGAWKPTARRRVGGREGGGAEGRGGGGRAVSHLGSFR